MIRSRSNVVRCMGDPVYFACNWFIEEVDTGYICDSFRFAEEYGCELTLLRYFWEDGQGYGYLTLVIKAPSMYAFEQFKSCTQHRLAHLDWRQVSEKTFQFADGFPEEVTTFSRKLDYLQHMLIGYARRNRNFRFIRIAEPIETLNLPHDLEQALKHGGIQTVGELYDAFFWSNRKNLDSAFPQAYIGIVADRMNDRRLRAEEELLFLRAIADAEIYEEHSSRFPTPLPAMPADFEFGRNPGIPEMITLLDSLKDCQVDYYCAGTWWDARIQKDGLKAFIQSNNLDEDARKPFEFTLRGDFALAREVAQATANQYGSFFLLGFESHQALLIPV
jgi:hypothetical protein